MGVRQARTHSRYPVDIEVTLESRTRDLTVAGKLVNLGVGGAACRMDAPLRMGEPVTLRIPTEVPQVLAAQIAWVAWGEATSVRVGLRFFPQQEELVSQLLDFFEPPSDVGT